MHYLPLIHSRRLDHGYIYGWRQNVPPTYQRIVQPIQANNRHSWVHLLRQQYHQLSVITSEGYGTQMQILCGIAFVTRVVNKAVLGSKSRIELFKQLDESERFLVTDPRMNTYFKGTFLITLAVGDIL